MGMASPQKIDNYRYYFRMLNQIYLNQTAAHASFDSFTRFIREINDNRWRRRFSGWVLS